MRVHLFGVASTLLCCTARVVMSWYLGGTVTLVPTNGDEYQVIRRTTESGSSCTQCSKCTDTGSTYIGWHTCTGKGGTTNSSYRYSSPTDWASGNGTGLLIARVYSTIRTDNGQRNNPPIANNVPIFYSDWSCDLVTIELPVYDLDGDVIRCRFATGTECGGGCDGLKGAWLHTDTCTLHLMSPSHIYNHVTIQVEDFYDETSSSALSTIPLQFTVYDLIQDMCEIPEIVTPRHKSEYTLVVGREFVLDITARGTRIIKEIETSRPMGMVISEEIIWSISNYSYMSINATWTPSPGDERAHIFCFAPQSGYSYYIQSSQTCVFLIVKSDCGSEIDTIISGSAEATSDITYGSTAMVTCNVGYENPTPSNVSCQSDGSWSSASCTIKVDEEDGVSTAVIVAIVVSIVVVVVIVIVLALIALRRWKRGPVVTQNVPSTSVRDVHMEEFGPEIRPVSVVVTREMTSEQVMNWFRGNNFKNCKGYFEEYTGADLLDISKEDLLNICGLADGVRLFNRLYGGNNDAPSAYSHSHEDDGNHYYVDLDDTMRT